MVAAAAALVLLMEELIKAQHCDIITYLLIVQTHLFHSYAFDLRWLLLVAAATAYSTDGILLLTLLVFNGGGGGHFIVTTGHN